MNSDGTIPGELLALLRCPETQQPLAEAPAHVLARAVIEDLPNRAGERPAKTLTGGLLRADGAVLYPVRNGIPILLVEQGIPLA